MEPPTFCMELEKKKLKLIKKRKAEKVNTPLYQLDIGWAEMLGGRNTQEDTISIIRNFCGDVNSFFFGVFDGHGGFHSTEYVASYLPVLLEENLQKNIPIEEALKESFKQMHHEIEKKKLEDVCEFQLEQFCK